MNNGINWSSAAKYGLLLSSVSVVTNLLTAFINVWQAPTFLGTILTIAAIVGNFYLLAYIVRLNAETEEYVDQSSSFKYAMAVCMFSTIVCCLFTLLTYTVFFPDFLETQLTAVFEQLEAMGTAEMLDFDELMASMPTYMVIGEALNCMFVGLIYSLIISRRFASYSNDPFAGVEDEQEDEASSDEK